MGFVGWRRQTPPVRTSCSCHPGAAGGPYEIVELLAQTHLSIVCTALQDVLGLSIESLDFLVEPEWPFLVSLAATQRCKFRDLFGSRAGRSMANLHSDPGMGSKCPPSDMRLTKAANERVTNGNGCFWPLAAYKPATPKSTPSLKHPPHPNQPIACSVMGHGSSGQTRG